VATDDTKTMSPRHLVGDARVVHENVDATELLDHRAHECLALGHVGHVALHRQ